MNKPIVTNHRFNQLVKLSRRVAQEVAGAATTCNFLADDDNAPLDIIVEAYKRWQRARRCLRNVVNRLYWYHYAGWCLENQLDPHNTSNRSSYRGWQVKGVSL